MLTDRLLLRRWREEDRAPFAALNSDPAVMRYLPAILNRGESDAFIERIEAGFDANGFGLWAVELRTTGQFVGFCGLSRPRFDAAFTPGVEVGWRLARPAWGHGYATEAAKAALEFGFERCDLVEIVSFTACTNARSRAVMQRLGMTHSAADDFDHPSLPAGHPLRPHVLYRMDSERWRSTER